MFKRVFLFLAMNLAIIIIISVLFAILENVFWLKLDLYWTNYTSIFIYSLIIWFAWSFISLALSKWMAKRAYNIKIINKNEVINLSTKLQIVWKIVEELAERNRIKMPEVWIYIDNEPNAFATWMSKNNSLVAVSTWLLENMENDAIEWVIWHEMSHILNWDMVTMTLLQWVLNTFVIFFARIVSNIISSMLDEKLSRLAYVAINIWLQMVFWLLASLVAMKFSRYREFRADAWSARFLWKNKMIAWLQALKKTQIFLSSDKSNFAAMKIDSKKKNWFFSLLSSHPDLDSRIKALENLSI